MRDGKGVDLDSRGGWDELGCVKREKTVIRIYCRRKEKKVYNEKRKEFKNKKKNIWARQETSW